jgi:alpha-tubulin suppressor-like RCC1 family protein
MPLLDARSFILLLLLFPSAHAATVSAAFPTADTVPIHSNGYSASGNDLNLSLSFAPPRGTSLTVVNNTGRSFISGRFSNLAHGQVVNLAHGGITYRFIANYFGGTGNDLVLHWSFQTACAWGLNTQGQLGNGSTTQRNTPVVVTTTGILANKTVIAVAAGVSHSLALCADGTIAAWGSNSFGELGTGNTTTSNVPAAVVATGALSNKTVVAIAAGDNHSLALCSDGTMVAWGSNQSGQLGTFNTGASISNVPVSVYQSGTLSGKTVVAIAAGGSHSLALCSDGTLAAWGDDSSGQLGNGSSPGNDIPILVDRSGVLATKSVVAIAAGYLHSLALCSDGTLAAWGGNTVGQLGIGTTGAGSTSPVLTSMSGGLAGRFVTAIRSSTYHNLALTSVGTLASWGSNSSGQLGNASTTTSSLPVAVSTTGTLSGKTITAFTAGGSHSLALCSDATLAAWGLNTNGQLGNNSTTSATSPLAITTSGYLSGRTAVAIATGRFHSLAVAASAVSNPTNESSLVNLIPSTGTLSPSFTSGHRSYTASVPTTTASITLTSTVANPSATLKVNDVTVASSAASAPIPLAYGSNAITIVVKAPDNVTTTTYTLTITRPLPSAINTLSSLTPSEGSLIPAFHPDTSAYFLRVSNPTAFLTLTPSVTEPNATLTLNGTPFTSGTTTAPLPLTVGTNLITLQVTAQNGTAIKTYTLTVVRAPSPASLLSGLSLGATSLYPAFKPAIFQYSASVPANTSSITLTPAAADPAAQISINGINVLSGETSPPIPLTTGTNTLTILLTAPDTSTSTYSLQIVRPASLDFTYTSASDTPAEFPAFDATGLSANVSLAFAPPVGTHLTVIRNTGVRFIQGRFLNLVHGQKIHLTYAGIPYRFVANYHGGDGNDLVLQWATRSLHAWGSNTGGALGNNGTTDSPVPVDVALTSAIQEKIITSITGGSFHSIALASDGSIAAWGAGSFGQLGNSSTSNRTTPVAVTASPALRVKTVVAIAASNHNLALCADGSLLSWGYNFDGQLGNGTTTNSNIPVNVLNTGALAGKSVIAIAVGDSHSLALCSDGSLAAWGNNSAGQLGNNSTSRSSTPVPVNTSGVLADKTITAIAAGGSRNLVLCSDGTLATWGNGLNNRLGNGGTTNSLVPVIVDTSGALTGKSVTAITAASGHCMVLCTDGTLAAWGINSDGQLGNGTNTATQTTTLIDRSGVLAGKSITHLTGGTSFSLALTADGSLAAWGSNILGTLGNGSTTSSNVPVVVDATGTLNQKPAVALAAAGYHGLALAASASPVPTTDYDLWLEQNLLWSPSSPTADPDRDTLPNLIEYVLNSNPGTPSDTALPATTIDGENIRFTFTRRAASAHETTQIFQFGTTLTNWTDVRITTPTDPRVTLGPIDGTGSQPITITLPKDPAARLFGRLQLRE